MSVKSQQLMSQWCRLALIGGLFFFALKIELILGDEPSEPSKLTALSAVNPDHFKLLPTEATAWRGYRGTQRHAQTPWLPDDLTKLRLVWQFPLSSPGLAGLVADEKVVITSTRDVADTMDIIFCIDAQSGAKKWSYSIPVTGDLDYGNSIRSTPWLAENVVFVQNAFGHLVALELTTGKLLWQKHLVEEFRVEAIPKWGYAASPLLVEQKLIIQPGASNASIVALKPQDGAVIWQVPGKPCPYSSLVAVNHQQQSMLIGFDTAALGGWSINTGERLWKFEPPLGMGISVSTPLIYQNKILLTDQTAGVSLFNVNQDGSPIPKPVGELERFNSQTHTPTTWKHKFFGVHGVLFVADMDQQLKESVPLNDGSFDQHCSIIASPDRVLILTADGRLILLNPQPDRPQLLGRTTIAENEKLLYSFPAVVGHKLYIRTTDKLLCISLGNLENP